MIKKRVSRNKNKGFTLIELLVVIAIVGLLSAVTMVALAEARRKAQDSRWAADAQQIQRAYELYNFDYNRYPYAVGTLPAAALQPYAGVIPTIFTSGPGSYFALSRAPGDPDWMAISDDGSGCMRIHNGYILAVGSHKPNNYTLNDGGLEPAYYERFGGDYKFYIGTPGQYSGGCPDY